MKENPNPDKQPIRLLDFAAEFGLNKVGKKKFVTRRGFEPFKRQQGQSKPNYISWDDAQELRKILQDEKDHRIPPSKEDFPTGLSGVYAIEVPAYGGSVRIKIGWSENIHERLSTYRTIVPDLRVLRMWPCTDNWHEKMALSYARNNGRHIGQELFEFDNSEVALEAIDKLFSSLGVKSQDIQP